MMATPVMMQPGTFQASDGSKTSQWSTGICDCCDDMSVCCLGFWCPCILMCNTSERFGECLCLPLLEFFFGSLIPPVTYAMRSSIRERYRIKGSMCDDCCVSTCCGTLVWCQIARELKQRLKPQVFINAPVNPAYQYPLPNQPQQPQHMMGP